MAKGSKWRMWQATFKLLYSMISHIFCAAFFLPRLNSRLTALRRLENTELLTTTLHSVFKENRIVEFY